MQDRLAGAWLELRSSEPIARSWTSSVHEEIRWRTARRRATPGAVKERIDVCFVLAQLHGSRRISDIARLHLGRGRQRQRSDAGM
jgi:hypothetical protein